MIDVDGREVDRMPILFSMTRFGRANQRGACIHLLCWMLLAVLGWGLNPNRRISQFAHTAWRMQEGVFGGRPFTLGQTAGGYLWIGTRNGLLKFDGVRFIPWLDDKLPSGEITSLLGARDGSLWIGTTQGLSHWDGVRLYTYPDVPGFVLGIREDAEGNIWASRTRQVTPLCRVSGLSAHCFGPSDGIPKDICCAQYMARDGRGNVWIGTDRALVRFSPGSSEVFRPRALQGNNADGVVAIVPVTDGSLWVGMEKAGPGLGLENFNNGKWSAFRAAGVDGSRLIVTALYLDREGALWIGTENEGCFRYYQGNVDHYGRNDGLTSDWVSEIFEDREGDLWVATPRGLDSFRNVHVSTWDSSEGLTSDNAVGVLVAHDGTIWVSNSGGLDFIRNGRAASIRTHHGLPGAQVTALFEDHLKRLWVGVDDTLNLFEKGRFVSIKRNNEAPVGFVTGIAEDATHDLWVETSFPKRALIHIRGT